MPATDTITENHIANLKIVSYPDPILRTKCVPIETFGDQLQRLAEKMWTLMHEQKGVGLAGPQVALPWRIFVWNPTGDPKDNQVSINPRLDDLEDAAPAEEGCLSIEGVTVNVRRARSAKLIAQHSDGSAYQVRGEELVSRIWQHETDHLDGRLILDYMSPTEQIANRRAIKELESNYKPTAKRKRR